MPSQPDLDGSRVHASRRGARSAPSLAPVRQQPSSSLAQSLFVSKLHGALKKPEPAEVTPEVDALLGKGSGDVDSTGAKAHSGGGRRGYTKAEVEEIRARINALIDAYEALELEEGEEGEEGAAATDVEGLKDAVGTMVMDFKKKATARTSTLQAAHAGLVKADAGDALARDGDRTPEEIMELWSRSAYSTRAFAISSTISFMNSSFDVSFTIFSTASKWPVNRFVMSDSAFETRWNQMWATTEMGARRQM